MINPTLRFLPLMAKMSRAINTFFTLLMMLVIYMSLTVHRVMIYWVNLKFNGLGADKALYHYVTNVHSLT